MAANYCREGFDFTASPGEVAVKGLLVFRECGVLESGGGGRERSAADQASVGKDAMGSVAQKFEVGGLSGPFKLFFGFTESGEEQFDLPVQPLVGTV